MQASGYAKDGSGIWAKDGKQLVLHWMANTGNKRREDTQAEFIPLLAKQGFKIVTDNSDDDTVFQKRLPAGDYDFSMFIQVASPDPTVTTILSCDSIPGPANKGQGQNDWWYCNPDADKLMKQSDEELDNAKRAPLIHQLDKILADDYLLIPLVRIPGDGGDTARPGEGPRRHSTSTTRRARSSTCTRGRRPDPVRPCSPVALWLWPGHCPGHSWTETIGHAAVHRAPGAVGDPGARPRQLIVFLAIRAVALIPCRVRCTTTSARKR